MSGGPYDVSYNNVKYTYNTGKVTATPNPDFTSNVLNVRSSVVIKDISYNVTNVDEFKSEYQLQYVTIPTDISLNSSAFSDCSGLLDVYMSASTRMSNSSFPNFSGTRPYFHLDGSGSSLNSDLSGCLFDASHCFVYYSNPQGWPVSGVRNPQFSEASVPASEGSAPVVSFNKLLSSGNPNINANDVLDNGNIVIFTNPHNGLQFVKLQNQS